MPTGNKDIKKLHATLIAKSEALFQKLGKTADPGAADALLEEMRELTRRIDAVQRLLFVENTARLSDRLDDVSSAAQQLDNAIASANSAAQIVSTMTTFLTVVDKAIDLAKTLVPAIV